MDEIRTRILSAAAAKGLTLKDLSLHIGKNHAYMQQFIERGVPVKLKEDDRYKLAGLLELPEAELGAPISAQTQQVPRTPGFKPEIVPGKQLVGERNFPVYAAAMGGDGHAIITFDAIEYVKRPSILENVKDAYGVYIVGDSMDPVYEPGDMALIHPHLPPARGKDVVLFHVPPAQEAECIIKRLVGFNDQDWKLKQYNPAKEFSEPRASWPYCHRVVGKYSSR
ncbi:S24 family peptidase [Phyllobacterium sp. K27]